MNDISDIIQCRTQIIDGYSYKLHNGGYGLDVVIPDDMEIDESQMSVVIPFADGNRRDGVGDLLEVGGIDTERHHKNPICLFDHSKQVILPIGLTENPGNHHYTVNIDPISKIASAKVFFYQGKSGFGIDKDEEYDHALFCEQLFDLIAKKYVRGGSIGYQVTAGVELPPDYQRGIPKGLHLLSVKMLEMSAVVMPANQDTVRKCLSLSKVCGKPLSPMLVKSLTPYAPEKKVIVSVEDNEKALLSSGKNIKTKATDHERLRLLQGENQASGHEREDIDNEHEWDQQGVQIRSDKEPEEGPPSEVRRNPKREEEARIRRLGRKNIRETYKVKAKRDSEGPDGMKDRIARRRYSETGGRVWTRGDDRLQQVNSQEHPNAGSTPEEDELEGQRDLQEMEETKREFERKRKKSIRANYKVKAKRSSSPDGEKYRGAERRYEEALRRGEEPEWSRGDQVVERIIYNDPEPDNREEEKSISGNIKSDYFQNCPRDETGHCLPKNEEDRGKDKETSHVRQGRREAHSPRTVEFGIFPGKTHTRSRKDALKVFADKQSASEYAKKYKNEHENGLIVAKIGGDEKSLGKVQVKGPIGVSEPDEEGRHQLHQSGRRMSTSTIHRETAESLAAGLNETARRTGADKKRDGSSRRFETETGYETDQEPRTEKSIPKKVKGPLTADEEPDEEGRYAIRTSRGRDSSYGSREQAQRVAESINKTDKKKPSHDRLSEEKCLFAKIKSIRARYKAKPARPTRPQLNEIGKDDLERIRTRTAEEHDQLAREADAEERYEDRENHAQDREERVVMDIDRRTRTQQARERRNSKSLEDENILRDKYLAEFKELEELTKKLDSLFIE